MDTAKDHNFSHYGAGVNFAYLCIMAKKIIMYSTLWCGDCYMARAFLKENDIKFEEINIEDDPGAAKVVMEINRGKRSVPTFDIDGDYFNGSPFTPEKRTKLAKRIGIESLA